MWSLVVIMAVVGLSEFPNKRMCGFLSRPQKTVVVQRFFSQKNAKYREIRQKYSQINVSKTYFILILAIRPVLFTPNVQIYLETSSLQLVNNVPKLPGVFR